MKTESKNFWSRVAAAGQMSFESYMRPTDPRKPHTFWKIELIRNYRYFVNSLRVLKLTTHIETLVSSKGFIERASSAEKWD